MGKSTKRTNLLEVNFINLEDIGGGVVHIIQVKKESQPFGEQSKKVVWGFQRPNLLKHKLLLKNTALPRSWFQFDHILKPLGVSPEVIKNESIL